MTIALLLLLFASILFGANAYIYIRLVQTVPTLPPAIKGIIIGAMTLVTCSMFASMLLRGADLPAWLSRSLFQTGSVWLVFLLYMVLSLALLDVLAGLRCPIPHRFWAALVFSIIILVAGNWRYHHPKIKEVKIEGLLPHSPRTPLTIVGISDVHLGEGTGVEALARYVDLINAQHPDIVVIAGDLIDNSVYPLYRDHMAKELHGIEAPLGIYMVPGNHEYISGIKATEQFIATTPITLLRDSTVTLPGGIQLIGRDDKSNHKRRSLSSLLKDVDPARPIIVLDHQPYGVAETDALGVDLLFCGHTHRGQVWPLTWVTDRLFEQSHGYRQWSNTHVYVSQGLSLWGPPFRIGSESELVVFKLY